MNNTSVFDKDLNPVLEVADNSDLETLVDYLKTKFSENLTTDDSYKNHFPNHSEYADIIAKEMREMGGNSFANVYRGEGPSYHEIVCDVADKMKVPYNKNKSIEDVENSILEAILVTAFEHMSEKEKGNMVNEMGGKVQTDLTSISPAVLIGIFRSGGFYSYQLTLIIANQVARAVLGRGLQLATNAALVRWASIFTGPIGWAISGVWTAIDVSGPSYKVTVPCVVHVAMLRKKLNSISCESCGTVLPDATINFCPECGNSLETNTALS
ncbi:MAG: ubiquinol-cytochrome C chaperone family protein [Gammaproteobacteria bacterium]